MIHVVLAISDKTYTDKQLTHFFDITPVLSKAYVARSTLSCGVFMHIRCQMIKSCKQRSYLLFLPNSMHFIINSVILSLQLDRDI